MSKLKLSNLEAFRILEIKLKGGDWVVVNPDDFIGSATVNVDAGLISEVSVTLMDSGVPADSEIGGIEYPRMDPSNVGTMRCRFSFGYVASPSTTRQMYEGFLKELSPSFPSAKPPRVELIFQCAGWEFTRVERTTTYPHIDQENIPEEVERRVDTDYEIDPTDRSWASVEDVDGKLRLETIIRNIIESYGYDVEIKLPDEDAVVTPENPIKQSNETDWAFLRRLSDDYSFGIYSDIVSETVDGSDDTKSLYKWFIVPEKDYAKTQQRNTLEFWFHREKGERVTEYDPSSKSKFIMMGEPNITMNSNWAFRPQLTKETNENGDEVYKETTINEDNQVVVYTIKKSMLNSDEADEYFAQYLQGKAGWAEAKNFFKRKAIEHNGAENKGENRAVFQGVEMDFQTAGNPLAEIGMSYPIKGLGSFYTKNMTLLSMTHTIDHKWETSYQFQLLNSDEADE